jgi:hypothetical protein
MTREQISFLKSHSVEINFFDRGCVVRVGCKSFAFESTEEAMAELQEYVKKPIEMGRIYAPDYFNAEELSEASGIVEARG